ncbi:hypothetical protein PAECIP111891_02126 [Paenibacillus allorhizoplanae]|uniref:Carboxypeptidase regulatory-like domain-containing protein n=1 Tax=Paenibacillus allorhizoplanae TaxID=2905648 RepID=A0ABN8GDP2_9BACL|nr:carboxypeptidase-like regulatory domain-containing protein [Paenibacillus allorhizoplanae]CAH1202297.1 hypothetical protein PAECIP111891_02126 [Paenibacillus allorhizoplanae]
MKLANNIDNRTCTYLLILFITLTFLFITNSSYAVGIDSNSPELSAAEAELQGTITDEFGAPIKGTQVEVFTYYFSATLPTLAVATTDENGHYTIQQFDRSARPGYQGIKFSIKGYQVYRSLPSSVHIFNFRFPDVLSSVSGNITLDRLGAIPIPGYTVSYDICVSSGHCMPLHSAITDDTGHFTITYIESDYGDPGHRGVNADPNHSGFEIGKTAISPPPGTLYGVVNGFLELANANVRVNGTVELVDVGTTKINLYGAFAFFNLLDKEYSLKITPSDWDAQYFVPIQKNNVRPSNTPLAIILPPAPDLKPPVTTDDSTLGWHNDDQTIHLGATDERSGVQTTYFSLDNATFAEGNVVSINGDGVHSLQYFSIDKAGNQEELKTVKVKIDKTKPYVVPPISMSFYQTDVINLHFDINDPLSGVTLSEIVLDNSVIENPTSFELLALTVGDHAIHITASDAVGNSTEINFVLHISINSAHFMEVLKIGQDRGLIDNMGIYKSLSEKAKHSSWDALEKEISAQSGKHINSDYASLLLDDIKYITTH